MADVPDEADGLFDVPVGDFVAARDDLVRDLKADGRGDVASVVRSLRRPTLSAWAVNRVVRGESDQFAALVAAGRTMQKAQRRALSGIRDSGLRDASTARRGLVEALTDHAARVLANAGARPDGHLEDVAATFEAASADPDAAATIAVGRLSAPVHVTTDFSGASALLAMSLATPDDGGADDDPGADPEVAARRRDAIRALEAARSRAESAALAAATAREEADRLSTEATEARHAATAAQAAAARAEATADELEARSSEATEHADATASTARADADAVDRARAVLDDLP